ncbi:MAG: helix-turn-helix domain-containing protein [Clostridiales bacterium]|nr:helix-turn-helix domain-containing protein [Clostridiales bacterium]MCF8022813.1 helix-turn-helix domain-containing protein [Clostridiales bacterium]
MYINVYVEKLSDLRVRMGYTQKALAKKVHISKSFICQLEKGTRNPGPEVAYRLHTTLGVQFDDLFYIQ